MGGGGGHKAPCLNYSSKNRILHLVSVGFHFFQVVTEPSFLNIQPECFLHGQKWAESYLKYVCGPLGHCDSFVCLQGFAACRKSPSPPSSLSLSSSSVKRSRACAAVHGESPPAGAKKRTADSVPAAGGRLPRRCQVLADSWATSGGRLCARHRWELRGRGPRGGGGLAGC